MHYHNLLYDAQFENDQLDKDQMEDVEDDTKEEDDQKDKKEDGQMENPDMAEDSDPENNNNNDPEHENGEYEVNPYNEGEEEENQEDQEVPEASNATLQEDQQNNAAQQNQEDNAEGQGFNDDNLNDQNTSENDPISKDQGQKSEQNGSNSKNNSKSKRKQEKTDPKSEESKSKKPKRRKAQVNNDNSDQNQQQEKEDFDIKKEDFEKNAEILDDDDERMNGEEENEDVNKNAFEKDEEEGDKFGLDLADNNKNKKENLKYDDVMNNSDQDPDDDKNGRNFSDNDSDSEAVISDSDLNDQNLEKDKKSKKKTGQNDDEMDHESEDDNDKNSEIDQHENQILDYESFFHSEKSEFLGKLELETNNEESTSKTIPKITQDQIRESLENRIATLDDIEKAEDFDKMRSSLEQSWIEYLALTQAESQFLCEQLRLILEPNQTAKLKGDYKSGKRLNMKKVIGYIASGFRRDKIWLRRTKPSKRTYQIMLSIDNSKSMKYNKLQEMTFESIAILSGSLSLLDVGQFGVCTFGENVKILHELDKAWTVKDGKYDLSAGGRILAGLKFDQTKTRTIQFLNLMNTYMNNMKQNNSPQLHIILSDAKGLFTEEGGRNMVQQTLQAADHQNLFTILIILDSDESSKTSVVETKKVTYDKKTGKPVLKGYLEGFPFKNYLIIRNLAEMPSVLSSALRSWFDMLQS